jgi:hypothetical protein
MLSLSKYTNDTLLKFIGTTTKTQRVKAILSKKNKARGIILPDFKMLPIIVIIKWQGADIKTHIDQWKRIENAEVNTHIYS